MAAAADDCWSIKLVSTRLDDNVEIESAPDIPNGGESFEFALSKSKKKERRLIGATGRLTRGALEYRRLKIVKETVHGSITRHIMGRKYTSTDIINYRKFKPAAVTKIVGTLKHTSARPENYKKDILAIISKN